MQHVKRLHLRTRVLENKQASLGSNIGDYFWGARAKSTREALRVRAKGDVTSLA